MMKYEKDSCTTCSMDGCNPANHVCNGCLIYQRVYCTEKGRPIPDWAENRWDPADWFIEIERLRSAIHEAIDQSYLELSHCALITLMKAIAEPTDTQQKSGASEKPTPRSPDEDEREIDLSPDPGCEYCHGTGYLPVPPHTNVDPPQTCHCVRTKMFKRFKLHCPTCGSTDLKKVNGDTPGEKKLRCMGCKKDYVTTVKRK